MSHAGIPRYGVAYQQIWVEKNTTGISAVPDYI